MTISLPMRDLDPVTVPIGRSYWYYPFCTNSRPVPSLHVCVAHVVSLFITSRGAARNDSSPSLDLLGRFDL